MYGKHWSFVAAGSTSQNCPSTTRRVEACYLGFQSHSDRLPPSEGLLPRLFVLAVQQPRASMACFQMTVPVWHPTQSPACKEPKRASHLSCQDGIATHST